MKRWLVVALGVLAGGGWRSAMAAETPKPKAVLVQFAAVTPEVQADADRATKGFQRSLEQLGFSVELLDRAKAETLAAESGRADEPLQYYEVGISHDRDREKLSEFVSQNRLPWLQVWDGKEGDESRRVEKLYDIEQWPTTILIDRKGVIRAMNLHGAELVRAVRHWLNQP